MGSKPATLRLLITLKSVNKKSDALPPELRGIIKGGPSSGSNSRTSDYRYTHRITRSLKPTEL